MKPKPQDSFWLIVAVILAAIACLIVQTGCQTTRPSDTSGYSFHLLHVEINAQIGGSRTHPTINVDNKLAEGATQVKELPIDYQIKADTPIKVTP